ncbi:putative SP-containing protein [Vairimorpha necatrix]|uniref:SP-containing protein n=1 Tax=Vairimorpha necatrix TaxID=6039 RepID=A0AAX4J9F5_9MICR
MFYLFFINIITAIQLKKEEIDKVIVLTNNGQSHVIDKNTILQREVNEYFIPANLFMPEDSDENNETRPILINQKPPAFKKKKSQCSISKTVKIKSTFNGKIGVNFIKIYNIFDFQG